MDTDAALAGEGQHGVVGAWSACGRVDDHEDVLVMDKGEGGRGEHEVDVLLALTCIMILSLRCFSALCQRGCVSNIIFNIAITVYNSGTFRT